MQRLIGRLSFPRPIFSLCFVALILLCGILVPLFEDETAYSMVLGRFMADNFIRMAVIPQCGNLHNPIPYDWWPAALFTEALFYPVTSPQLLRLLGISFAFLNVYLIYRCCADFTDRSDRPAIAFFLLIALAGVCPLITVISRPDQALVAYCLILIRLSQLSRKSPPQTTASRAVLLLVMVFIVSIGITNHPASIMLLPLTIWALYYSGLPRRWFAAALVIIAILVAQGIQFHSLYFSCPLNPKIEAFLSGHRGESGASGILGLLYYRLKAIAETPLLIRAMLPRSMYPFGMLPQLTLADHPVAVAAVLTSVVLTVVLLAWFNFKLLAATVFQRGSNWQTSSSRNLYLAIWLSVAIAGATMLIKSEYRISFFYPLVIFATAAGLFAPAKFDSETRTAVSASAGLFGLVSAPFVLLMYLPPLWAESTLIRIPDQHQSAGILSTWAHRDEIAAAKDLCGLKNSAENRLIATDQTTYWGVRRSAEPILLLSVIWENDPSAEAMLKTLKQLGSEGALNGCEMIPPEFLEPLEKAGMKRVGDICCISKEVIQSAGQTTAGN